LVRCTPTERNALGWTETSRKLRGTHRIFREFRDTHRNSRAPRIACSQLASLPSGCVVDPCRLVRGRGVAGGRCSRVAARFVNLLWPRFARRVSLVTAANLQAPQTFVRVPNCVFVRVPNCAPSVQRIPWATHRVAPTLPAGSVQVGGASGEKATGCFQRSNKETPLPGRERPARSAG
jgi:hypothetical protein